METHQASQILTDRTSKVQQLFTLLCASNGFIKFLIFPELQLKKQPETDAWIRTIVPCFFTLRGLLVECRRQLRVQSLTALLRCCSSLSSGILEYSIKSLFVELSRGNGTSSFQKGVLTVLRSKGRRALPEVAVNALIVTLRVGLVFPGKGCDSFPLNRPWP